MKNSKNTYFITTIYLTVFLLISFNTKVFSQDYLILHSGEEIEVRIFDFHQSTISYRIYSDMSGETKIIDKKDVLLIRYQDGSNVVVKDMKNIDTVQAKVFLDTDLKNLAVIDANKYYKNINPAMAACCCSASCLPFGIPLAAYAASQPPQRQKLKIPDEYINNEEYIKYYTKEAHKIKRKKIFIGTIVALPVNLALLYLLIRQ